MQRVTREVIKIYWNPIGFFSIKLSSIHCDSLLAYFSKPLEKKVKEQGPWKVRR